MTEERTDQCHVKSLAANPTEFYDNCPRASHLRAGRHTAGGNPSQAGWMEPHVGECDQKQVSHGIWHLNAFLPVTAAIIIFFKLHLGMTACLAHQITRRLRKD